jgi:anti-anti-sigma factor
MKPKKEKPEETRTDLGRFTLEQNGRQCTVALRGDFTVELIAELQASLKAVLRNGALEVTFDLGRTNLLDSSGIGLLIATSNSLAKTNGKVRVVNASDTILRLLQTMRLVVRLNAEGRTAREGNNG